MSATTQSDRGAASCCIIQSMQELPTSNVAGNTNTKRAYHRHHRTIDIRSLAYSGQTTPTRGWLVHRPEISLVLSVRAADMPHWTSDHDSQGSALLGKVWTRHGWSISSSTAVSHPLFISLCSFVAFRLIPPFLKLRPRRAVSYEDSTRRSILVKRNMCIRPTYLTHRKRPAG